MAGGGIAPQGAARAEPVAPAYGLTVTVFVVVAVWPAASAIVSRTTHVFAAANDFVTRRPDPVVPSPKSHVHDVALGDEDVASKMMFWFLTGLVGENVKSTLNDD